MEIGQEMFAQALNLLNQRYGENKAGGVAIMRTDRGNYLLSVWPEAANESVTLCAEVGAICEAHKLGQKVTHTLCLCRQNDDEDYEILAPCGLCQERLFFWGEEVQCAISTKDNSVVFKSLRELQPYYWLNKQ